VNLDQELSKTHHGVLGSIPSALTKQINNLVANCRHRLPPVSAPRLQINCRLAFCFRSEGLCIVDRDDRRRCAAARSPEKDTADIAPGNCTGYDPIRTPGGRSVLRAFF
jgi:hypothetical protein